MENKGEKVENEQKIRRRSVKHTAIGNDKCYALFDVSCSDVDGSGLMLLTL